MALKDIDHIVIVMMENRSFDHMLGYLAASMPGLRGSTTGKNPSSKGTVHASDLGKSNVTLDVPHDTAQVAKQVNGGRMDGFATEYEAIGGDPAQAMGHYTGARLPTYDALASNYVVCDQWFSSMPGPTWPNRHFALCGHSNGVAENLSLLDLLKRGLGPKRPTFFDGLRAGVTWRSYSHDISFLRTVPGYLGDKTNISKMPSFYNACAKGTLPNVAWIDPDFADFPTGQNNDDHPPSDVSDGQSLIARIYTALTASTCWPKTLFIVVYDEHGGFYDHVAPPAAVIPAPGQGAPFDSYGVRVPAIVVSPWVGTSVDHTVRDHTCIARTVLDRFGDPRSIPDLGDRVAHAASLAPLLNRSKPKVLPAVLPAAPPPRPLIAQPRFFGPPGVPQTSKPPSTGLVADLAEVADLARKAGVPDDAL